MPLNIAQQGVASVQSLPAPVGGWNARDSLANMDPTDAVLLENLFPTVSNVVMRGGYQRYATGLGGQVQTLMAYSASDRQQLFAVAETSNSLYDVTDGGPVGAPKVSGLSSAIWEYINVTTAGGNFLYAVNGADKPILYNGSTWVRVDGSSSIAVTGVTTNTLSNITLFKNRVWFIEKNTLRAWYLPTGSVGGAAQVLDLSAVAKYGGHLVDLDTWTIDAGYGVDDNLVFVTSNGEVIVYRGTDPSSAATWALSGIWKLGSPIGNRCMLKYGGDLLILTYDGLLPLAQSLQSSRLDPRVALSNKIQGAIAQATTLYGGTHAAVGWQITYTAKNNAVWINVPVATNQQQQYVMNTITQSWCNFTGWGANCWEVFNDDPYFGGDGYVGKAWTTDYADNQSNIQTNAIQAFNYFDSRGVKKYFTRARPTIFSDGTPAILLGMNVDFDLSTISSPIALPSVTAAEWNVATWDNGYWGQNLSVSYVWQGITGIGYCGALQFKTTSAGTQIQWTATDVVFQTGWAGI
jgi:hypothetical protein